MKLRLNCREVARLLSQRLDGNVTPADGMRMRMHLLACRNCRTAGEQMDFLRLALQRLGAEEPPRRRAG
jgi:predicted anti-sigma-YlaC factor YlaD